MDDNKIQERLLEKIRRGYDYLIEMMKDIERISSGEPKYSSMDSIALKYRLEQEVRLSLYRQALRVSNYMEIYKENFVVDGGLIDIESELEGYLKEEDYKIAAIMGDYMGMALSEAEFKHTEEKDTMDIMNDITGRLNHQPKRKRFGNQP